MDMATYSTFSAARTAYLSNADYADDGDLDKARDFRSACRALLLLMPAETSNDATATRMSPQLIEKQLATVDQFIGDRLPAVADAVGRTMLVNMEDFREI